MASDKKIPVEKVVTPCGSDLIKGDPGRGWNAPPKPAPPVPSTDSTVPQSNGNANSGGNSASDNQS